MAEAVAVSTYVKSKLPETRPSTRICRGTRPGGRWGDAHLSRVALMREAGTCKPPKLHRSFAEASKNAPVIDT